MNWLKKTPTALLITIIIVVAVSSLAYLGGFIYLTAEGKDTTEYRALLNTVTNWVTLLLVGTGTAASVSAARSSSNTEDTIASGQLDREDPNAER